MKIKLIGLALIFLTAVSASAAPLSEPAQLRTQLPANALGYLRIPSPWGVLSTPKGTVLNEALADEKHQAQLRKLIEGLSQNVLKQAEPYIHPVLALLLERLRSPIEIVSLLAEDAPPQMANVLLRAKLDLASLAEANALLPKLIAGAPLEIGRPFSEDGHAMLVSPQGALLLHYDPAQKTFSAMTGLVATPDEFRRVLASLAPVERHPMHVLEEQIDASAQGLFAWLNLQRLLPLLRAAIPPEEWANWDKFGLSQARAMAYGLGVSRGKTRLKLLIDSPRSGLLALAPKIENRLSLTASGRPDAVFALNAPAAALLQSYEQFAKAQAEADPQMLAALVQLKSAFQAQTGMALEEALGAFGNEVVAFIDAAGEYAAIRIDDRARWEKLLNWLTTAFELRHEVREIEGRVYHHLQTPGFMSLQASPVDTPAQAFWREVLARVATHYYWVEEGDYLILGQTPQILFDRARHAEHIPIGDWLAQSQKLDYRSAVLLLSFSIDKTPRRLYYTYLQLLNALGDMAQTEFDLFALPSAAELRLPAVGGYGLQVFLGEDLLGAELAFENNPAEFLWALQGDAATGLALAGILAAIAIPAYHDYLTRAKVAEGLALLNGLKGPAEAYFAAQGRLPEADELAEMGVSLSGEHTEVIFLLDDGSGYAATFDDPAIGGWLLLFYDSASGVWECGYDEMPEKFVPAACR